MENNKITTKRARVQGKWTNLPKKGLEAKEKGIIYTKKRARVQGKRTNLPIKGLGSMEKGLTKPKNARVIGTGTD